MSENRDAAETVIQALYDVGMLQGIQRQVEHMQASGHPMMELVTSPAQPAGAELILLLPGAYNPLTVAHVALAEAAIQASKSSALLLVMSLSTINKERTERASLLDRLLLLHLVAQRLGFLGVLLTNRGLYVEQAEAAHLTFPAARDLRFVVGFDKIEQIFDARYYTDRDAALKRLFALASLLAAPRASQEADDLAALMQQPENQAFHTSVHLIPLPNDLRAISSSQVRAALQHQLATNGSTDTFGPTDALPADFSSVLAWLPPEVSTFCAETRCYSPPLALPNGERIDHYGLRDALIQRALALPAIQQARLHLRPLFQLAISDTAQGAALRRWLVESDSAQVPSDLLSFQPDSEPEE